MNAIAANLKYISANPNEAVFSTSRSAEGSAGRFFRQDRKRFKSAQQVQQDRDECLEEPRTGMDLNGTTMIQRRMKLNSDNADFELTHMEIACLKFTANGYRPIEIGSELESDEKEIEILLSSAERKLRARNRLHAVGIAVSQGLIGIDGK